MVIRIVSFGIFHNHSIIEDLLMNNSIKNVTCNQYIVESSSYLEKEVDLF